MKRVIFWFSLLIVVLGLAVGCPRPGPTPTPPTVITPAPPAAMEEVVPMEELIAAVKRITGTWDPMAALKVVAREKELLTPEVTIDIEAKRSDFTPSEIKVKKGQVVKLRIKGLDSGLLDLHEDIPAVKGLLGLKEFSGHGFQILGPYDVWITGIRKDIVQEVVFKADEAGEFEFQCTVFCSPDHYLMRGKLIVE